MSDILTAVSNAVRSRLAGFANQAVSAGASEIRKIAGLTPEGSSSALGENYHLSRRGNTQTLTYPLNVDTDPQQGHYIMFYIYMRENGTILSPKKKKDIFSITEGLLSEEQSAIYKAKQRGRSAPTTFGQDPNSNVDIGIGTIDDTFIKIPKVSSATGGDTRGILYGKLPVKKLEKCIALYMPPNVQANYNVKYVDKEIGSLAIAGSDAINAFMNSGGSLRTKIETAMKATGPAGKEALQVFLNKTLDTFAEGSQALLNLERGTVVTPRMEMMFEGVGRREFSYTFNFMPKSEQESQIVEEIITHFKFYMMPKYSNPTTRREMDIPGFFEIAYMHDGRENSFLNKVKPSFLTSVQVEYGGDRYTTYERTESRRGFGLPPQKSKLTLNFTELEVLSQESIELGF